MVRKSEKVVAGENFRARNDSITTIQSDTRSVRSFSISSYRSDVTETASYKLTSSPTAFTTPLSPSQSTSSPARNTQTTSPSPTNSYPRSSTPPSPQSGSPTTPQSPSSEAHTFEDVKTVTDADNTSEIKDTDDADGVNEADDASETSDAIQESDQEILSPRFKIGPPVLPPLSFSFEDDLVKIIENTRSSRQNSVRKSKLFTMDDAALLLAMEGKSVDILGLGEEAEVEDVLTREHERKDIPRVMIECEEESATALKAELIETKKKLIDVSNKYQRIKRISREALVITHNSYTEERVNRHEAEVVIEELQAKLAARNKKIAELKQENDAKDRMIKDSQALKLQLEEMRSTLKDLSMQKELLLKEIEGLTKEKEDGVANNPSSLVRHISTHLDEVKQSYISDIRSLQTDSDSLRKETENLRILRDQCIEEARALNEKNLELADLNNELMQQIDAHQKTSKGALNGFGFFRTRPSATDKETYACEHARTSSVATLDSMVSNDGGNNHYKEGTQVLAIQRGVAHRNSINRGETPKKFKWKKGGVLNKFLHSSNDENRRASPSVSPTSTLTGNEQQEPTTFYRLVKCEHCSEKIWGINMDMRCSACGAGCHQKCVSSCTSSCTGSLGTYADENESITSITATIFGIELQKQLETEGRDIPLLVEKCIKAVEARGMDFEGIYRKSGGMSQMKAIIMAFEQGEDLDLNSPVEFNDIGAVTSVLRQFFRELPDPLFTTGLYNKFLEAAALQAAEDKLDRFRQVIAKLPKGHYLTARYLMNHLYEVRQAGSENLMSAKSLSVVFGPTILKGRDPNTEIIDMKLRNSAVEFMIENAPKLWPKNIVIRKDGFL
ncbi:9294_t:CDS:2 [Paraglomus brasilianum]|uniref:9294_t:CDS:1 n=1 Tax=Paraglomus brasilianum TaxID=144538 RepID=A0A9N9FVX5_9GLOM|nr:9294_t:CDS:2 [Paraglomus brasilianum]